MATEPVILIRGGGDLGTGCAVRLARCGFRVLITESRAPVAVRRSVSLSEAVYDGTQKVEDVTGILVGDETECATVWTRGAVAVMVDPDLDRASCVNPAVLIDATMRKRADHSLRGVAPATIGLGPGFTAGDSVDAVIETNRGPDLGRV